MTEQQGGQGSDVAAPGDSPDLPTDSASAGHPPVDRSAAAVPRRHWLRRHPVVTGATGVVLLAVLVLGLSYAWVRTDSADHLYRTDTAPSAPVALVLGAGLRPDGSPSQYLQDRLDDAATLYRNGRVSALLVSGDNGTTTHDEPTAMRDYLAAHGVPAAQIIRDYAGFDTHDSCVRAKRIFGVDRALVVTQEFHLPRAVFLCRQAGIEAAGVADPHPGGVGLRFTLREIPAAVKAAWDAIWEPDPKFLGPQETDLAAAFAHPAPRPAG
jgi:vancomycin permeability regulator SanA